MPTEAEMKQTECPERLKAFAGRMRAEHAHLLNCIGARCSMWDWDTGPIEEKWITRDPAEGTWEQDGWDIHHKEGSRNWRVSRPWPEGTRPGDCGLKRGG